MQLQPGSQTLLLRVNIFFLSVIDALPWVPMFFFFCFVLYCGDSERRSRDRERANSQDGFALT